MTTEAILRKSIRYDRCGNPLEVVIPHGKFVVLAEWFTASRIHPTAAAAYTVNG